MDLNTLSLVELKALAYDIGISYNVAAQNLKIINTQIEEVIKKERKDAKQKDDIIKHKGTEKVG